MDTPSRVATLAGATGIAALAAVALGPLVALAGFARPVLGFYIFGSGIPLGLVAIPLGLVGLWFTRPAIGGAGRSRALAGAGLGGLALLVIFGPALGARDLPPINDITTDTEDPPVFVAAQRIEANEGRDLAYPGAGFASQQRAGYPDLAPQRLIVPTEDAFRRAREAATGLGWEITAEDTEAGTIEAIEVTAVFRFVDDIAIRVRPDDGGSVVDARSKSRDGKADLGANATRIRAFQQAIRDGATPQ